MKLLSFRWKDRDRIGFTPDEKIVFDLGEIAGALGRSAYPDMLALIEAGEEGQAFLRAARAFAEKEPGKLATIDIADIVFHPPVRRPSKICGVALNNSASNERKISAPDHPLFFLKPASSLVGHNQPIEVYDYYGSVHPEPELAVIIGEKCRHVPADKAMDVVYGYSILNDMTGNFMRSEDMVHYYALYPTKEDPTKVERREQHLSYTARYKGSDTFGPFGPYLVTKDEVRPAQSRGDVLAQGRSDRRGFHGLLYVSGARGDRLYHPLSLAVAGRCDLDGDARSVPVLPSAACTPPTSPPLAGR